MWGSAVILAIYVTLCVNCGCLVLVNMLVNFQVGPWVIAYELKQIRWLMEHTDCRVSLSKITWLRIIWLIMGGRWRRTFVLRAFQEVYKASVPNLRGEVASSLVKSALIILEIFIIETQKSKYDISTLVNVSRFHLSTNAL